MDYRIADRMKNARGSVIRDLLKLAGEPGMISFGGGSPDPKAFPAEDIRRVAERALAERPAAMLQYGVSEGYQPLRESLKKHLEQTEGIGFADNDLIILSGGQQCADLVAKLFVNEGDTVAVESPSFVGCMNAFRSYGGRLLGVPMREDGVDLGLLEEAFSRPGVSFFYIIPTFQNPSGYTTSLEKRRAIYGLAQKHGVMIFEDNPYGELRFEGEPVPPLKSMDTDGRVIYAGSFSKTMAPGLRVGFLVFHRDLFDRFKIAKQGTDVHSSTLYQLACHEFLTGPRYQPHVAACRELYRRKCALMYAEMKKCFHPAVRFARPQGGLFQMAWLPEGMDSGPFVQEALKRRVITVPGSAFTTDPDKPNNGVRLNFTLPSEEQIVQGIGILGKLTREVLEI